MQRRLVDCRSFFKKYILLNLLDSFEFLKVTQSTHDTAATAVFRTTPGAQLSGLEGLRALGSLDLRVEVQRLMFFFFFSKKKTGLFKRNHDQDKQLFVTFFLIHLWWDGFGQHGRDHRKSPIHFKRIGT